MSTFDDEEASGVFDTALENDVVSAEDRARVVAGRYEIVETIGSGGMGQVFRVKHRRLGKAFALKLMHAELSMDPNAEQLFQREARLASQLSHPHIVETIDFGADPDWGLFLVMEHLEGESLATRITRMGKLPIATACEVAAQLADALQHSHDHGVVHADLKSENVFCVGDETRWHVKLLDFGTANTTSSKTSDRMTGTPEYLAPERITGATAQPSSDIYALGVILYEMLCGTPPFAGGETELILHRQLAESPEPVSARRKEDVDARLQDIVSKALAKDPADRYKSARELQDVLREYLDALGIRRRARTEPVGISMSDERAQAAASAFDALRLPVAGVRRDGRIAVANAAFAHLLGFKDVTSVEGTDVHRSMLAKLNSELHEDLRLSAVEGRVIRRYFVLPRGEKPVRVRYIMAPASGPCGDCLVTLHSA